MNSAGRLSSIHDLMEEILDIQRENSKTQETIERVHEIIQKSNSLVEKSESANEILIDAKILHAGSQVVTLNVSSFDTNLTSFNEVEYSKGILNYLRKNSSETRLEKSWECLAPVTYHLYYKSIPATFMLGSLSLEPVAVKEKVKHERTKKVCSSKTKLAATSDNSQSDKESLEENIYEHILKSLVRHYKANGKKPLSFIEFILNPDSYWYSVENIFYFSFLVRDARVNVFLDNDGLPVVEPLLRNEENDLVSRKVGNQFCFSLSKQEWRDCIAKFEISSPKIRPFNKS